MRVLLLAWLLLPCLASGQSETDAARIGRAADLQGMRALIAQRNQTLLFTAARSWNFAGARELSPGLESLVVEHYADTVAQRPLLGLIARELDRFQRYPKYRSRELFDLMYADLKAGKDTLHYAIRIIATDLPVDAQLMGLLGELDPAAANEIVMFLGSRKYAPAVAALQALQARVPHERNTNQMIERVDWAYLQIGTPQSIAALLARLRALGSMRTEAAGFEVWNILLYAGQLPADSPPSYAELAAALPAELNDDSWGALAQLIVKRREKAGMPQLLRAIAQSSRPEDAVDAVLAIGEPADWRAARASLAQSRAPRAQLAILEQRLDGALAEAARFVAQRERQQSERLFGEERRRIAGLKTTDPARYAAGMSALLAREEKSTPRPSLAQDYLALAALQRFSLRRPDDALVSYQAASRLRPPDSFDIAGAAAADVHRFDKRDSRKALEHYRAALASYRPAPFARDAAIFGAFRRWLEREIDFVERGRRFTGTIDRHDVEMAYLWIGMAAMQEPLGSPDPAELSRLPASQYQLGRAFPAMTELAPRDMLAFLEKHDPAGYLSAALLAYAMYKEPSPYVKSAAETFFRSRGIRMPNL